MAIGARRYLEPVQRLFLEPQICLDTEVRGDGFFVSEPQGDNLEGNSGLEQMLSASMPQSMRGDRSSGQRCSLRGRLAHRQRQTLSYAVTGKTISPSVYEYGLLGSDLIWPAPAVKQPVGLWP